MKNFFRILIALILVCLLGFTYIAGSAVTSSFTQLASAEKTGEAVTQTAWNNASFNYEKFTEQYAVEEFTVSSSEEDHQIPCIYLNASKEADHAKDTVIMVHDLGSNKECMYPAAMMYLKNGMNVVVFDQRSHGENTAKYTTFGYLEKYDVLDVMNYVSEEAGEKRIGIHAVSYGALAACQAAGYENAWHEIDFMVLESPMKDLSTELHQSLNAGKTPLPSSILYFAANLVNKMKLGFFFSDASAAESLKSTNIPVMVICSEADRAVSIDDSKDVFNAVSNKKKKLWTVTDSEHHQIYTDHTEEYEQKVMAFLSK